jgi:hypothetical protein
MTDTFNDHDQGFCGSNESFKILEEYVVTRTVQKSNALIPPRFAAGTASVVGDHGTYGGKVVADIPFGGTFAKPPRVFATAVRLADPNNDYAVFAVEVLGVRTDRFNVMICKINTGPGPNTKP